MPMADTNDLFDRFESRLRTSGPDAIHDGEIGRGVMIDGLLGPVPLLYADHVASGRALRQVEEEVAMSFLPYYANSHTEASFCGAMMTSLRRAARAYVSRRIGAGADHAVIFAGSGATAGLSRLPHLFGFAEALAEGRQVLVCHGPYEHHSNLLPWRESGARVVGIPEAAQGGPCPDALRDALRSVPAGALKVGAFSAASNVTGALSDVAAMTRLLKSEGALAVWDYAGGGPYLPIRMTVADAEIDAISISPHKFIGGPGSSGILAVRRTAVRTARPSVPGGGTVRFVSPWRHDYSSDLEAREEGGTPNVLGDLRTALAFAVKEALGEDWIAARNTARIRLADAALANAPGIERLPIPSCQRLPILSFRVQDPLGGYAHHQLATRLLSDRFGIQARGGCACAGPYVHHLLDIDEAGSNAILARLDAKEELAKPGFVRLNLSHLLTDEEVAFILNAIQALPREVALHQARYVADPARAIFRMSQRAQQSSVA